MFEFFKSQIKPNHNLSVENEPIYHFQSSDFPDAKLVRLMELIGNAIDEWALEYDLGNIPRKIIFEQALDAMKVIDFSLNNKL